ncbi:MAG: L-glyceraldehyde 3-phosphate reductase [Acutalibacteraceae bacterium]|nr:L-glyceraldehyde 3-phosphate reductase [Acutalibacteraceae bacterium]
MYKANSKRYDIMQYQRCGKSGLLLPRIALGLWHNFGTYDSLENQKSMLFTAFDNGITHFDLANNYGPEPGSAEENFGKILKTDLKAYRNEIVISTKAGYYMWPGPYGDFGSRKYILSSLDDSLKRIGLDYVDIFYHHRPDPNTPLEETMTALSDAVKSGKALYVGLSNYKSEELKKAAEILKRNGTPLLITQPSYSMLNRWIEEDGLIDTLEEIGAGCICFSPLAQGRLSDKYLSGIPENSRAAKSRFLPKEAITTELLDTVTKLNDIAKKRGQTLAQMALSWALRDNKVTTVLIGASNAAQIEENIKILENLSFTSEELNEIENVLKR